MIVGREQLVVLEEFIKKQEQIYPDACDWGYRWIEGPIGVAERNRLRDAVAELMGIFKAKTGTWGNQETGGKYADLFIPYEQDGAEYTGVRVIVTTCWDRRRRVTFTSVDIRPWKQEDAGFRGE